MSENKVLAVVEGKEITQEALKKFINELGPLVGIQIQSAEEMKRVLYELVTQEVIYLDAKEKGIDKEEEYIMELEKFKEGLMKRCAINKMLKDVTVLEEEVEKHYNDNKDSFKKPESIVASHILVEGEEQANDIVKEISEGLSFEDAALKYSTCPSKAQGGNLGEFNRGQMVPEFDQVVFDMEIGPISDPIKTQFGYHIIKVLSKSEISFSPFEEVKEELTQQLLDDKKQDVYVVETDKLKEKYDIVVNV